MTLMDMEHFRRSPAGRLVRAQTGYHAFVPHPLPPPLEWNAEMVFLLSEADRAVGELAGVGRTLPNPNLLIRPFVRREAVLSSRIEGTQASLTDLLAYEVRQLSLLGPEQGPAGTDVREVANYVSALEYGLDRLQTLPVSLRLIREVHGHLLKGVRGERATPGEFRRSQNWIGPAGCTLDQAVYVPPPVPEMHEALNDFEKFLHRPGQTPPLVRLAMIHYQFEAIHPFLDGNGRIGRLLLTLLLCEWGLLPQPLLYLSAFFERHRPDYYDKLLAVSAKGDWWDWIAFFLRAVVSQATDAVARSQRLQDLHKRYREVVQRARSSALLLNLIDALFTSPLLTIPSARDLLGVSFPSAQRNVQKLVDYGILEELTGQARNRIFVAPEVLRAIED